jgi:hypothetical protein
LVIPSSAHGSERMTAGYWRRPMFEAWIN